MVRVIFITGGSASGKTTLAVQLQKALGVSGQLISQDMFYKPTRDPKTNYDIPGAFDFDEQYRVLLALTKRQKVSIPVYDFNLHDRVGETELKPTDVIIFEGLFAFHHKDSLKLADLKIFVDTPDDTRLGRRIMRDVYDRKRELRDVIKRWNEDVQPSYRKYISLTRYEADLIIPWTTINHRAIGFLLSTIAELGKVKHPTD